MGKYNRNRIDTNQTSVVAALRKIPGVKVLVDHDDILIGRNGFNWLVEIKDPAKTLRKDGRVKPDVFKKSQIDLMRDWPGQYRICWTLDEILEVMGISPKQKERAEVYKEMYRRNR